MTSARNRKRYGNSTAANYWPGFVDAMSTLLLSIIFLLSLFILSNFLITNEITSKDKILIDLREQILSLSELLALERTETQKSQDTIFELESTISSLEEQKQKFISQLDNFAPSSDETSQLFKLSKELQHEKAISQKALRQIAILNRQISSFRQQLAILNAALEAAESKEQKLNSRILDLGNRLNLALAQKLQELARYRSNFFGKLRIILEDKENIKIEGDRFVFSSEVLFDSGADVLTDKGLEQLKPIAKALVTLQYEIPKDINWIIRVDGHTDSQPISSDRFPSNWELSNARAISVVKFFITNGIEPENLAATGFSQYQPINPNKNSTAYKQNRRIEIKITDK